MANGLDGSTRDCGEPAPSLDCAFYDFMRTRAVVSFYFDADLSTPDQPRFTSGRSSPAMANVRTSPVTIAPPGDGKPTITSQDGTNWIVLYGLKLGAAGTLPVEAGIRSNGYRNLGGECRQTNLNRDSP